MADSVKEIISAGVELAEFHVLDSGGYISGSTGTVASGAAGAAAGRIRGIQTASVTTPDDELVTIPGDDGVMGAFTFEPDTVPQFTIDVGVQDLDDEAAFQTSRVYQRGNLNMGILQPSGSTLVDMLVILTSKTKAKTPGSDGISRYSGYILPKVNARPKGRVEFAGRQGAVYRYACVANVSDTFGAGETMRADTFGTESGVIIPWTGLYRLTAHRFTGDGVTTAFTLGKTPATSTAADFQVWINGVVQNSGYSVNTTTKVITFSPAPALNAKIVVAYFFVNS